ncbi:MAG: 7-carboxy-7-deazaguanine synthase [Pseudomonadota bacterium]|nr:7-carboxy-7-deazaguanine synthase [Pseudomonadota bacterium]
MYSIKEIYFTLQGEGAQAGRAAVFCRFSGCNLWSGREEDRASAVCKFCDTDFVGMDGPRGGRFTHPEHVVGECVRAWEGAPGRRLVVFTGGEPMLQVDQQLIDAIHRDNFDIAIETNGTIAVPREIDWICVSPKAGAPLEQRSGNELKLVYPQKGIDPTSLNGLAFDHYFLQPMDGPRRKQNTQAALDFCIANPRWRLSLQTHKLIGIP